MRANCEYSGYKSSDSAIQWFWSTLKGFSKEEKALFLQFVTGTSKVPLDGFKALIGSDGPRKMNIHRVEDTTLLPAAHTCFNQLGLPEYGSEEQMRRRSPWRSRRPLASASSEAEIRMKARKSKRQTPKHPCKSNSIVAITVIIDNKVPFLVLFHPLPPPLR